MVFKFDPNSTKNQGRWRLRDPKDFVSGSYITKKMKNGISYILGKLDDKFVVQAIRFDKDKWTEKEAAEWWEKRKSKYTKIWSEDDWREFKRERKTGYEEGIKLCKKVARKLKIKYINPKKVTIDTEFIKDVMIPVGSLRRGKLKVGDIDMIVTKKINKEDLKNIKGFTNVIGGEKIIKFKFENVKFDLFVFLNPKTFGSAALHSTGPFEYNRRLRFKVKNENENWKLSQNGLVKNGRTITTRTERDLQRIIGVKERNPEER